MAFPYGVQRQTSIYPGAYGGVGLPTPQSPMASYIPTTPVAQSPIYGAPVGADPTLWQWFSMVDVNRSGTITEDELQRCLTNGDFPRDRAHLDKPPFDMETVRMLMTLFDTKRNGTITFNEFASVYKYVKEWQVVFMEHDIDRSGAIDRSELKDALRRFGFDLNPQIMHLILFKYQSNLSSRSNPQPEAMTFDRFVRACVTLKSLTDAFTRLDTFRTGTVQMNYDTFLATVLSAP